LICRNIKRESAIKPARLLLGTPTWATLGIELEQIEKERIGGGLGPRSVATLTTQG